MIDIRRVTKGWSGPLTGDGKHEVTVSTWDYPVCVKIEAPSSAGLMQAAIDTLERVVDMNFPVKELID